MGRVRELLILERELREARKHFDAGEGKVKLERGGRRKRVVIDGVEAEGKEE